MSKVLKFIVHFVVICTLICVLGLVLPPFFGVRTVIVDKSDKATNLPVGSVTYAIPEKSSAISAGTPILVQKDSETYKYTITNLDASKGTGTVTDQSVSGGKTFTIKAPRKEHNEIYIRSMRLNGKKYTKNYITHQDIMNGGTLEFVMTASPGK